MLRILTQKLKSQSLNEIQPVQQTQTANMKNENAEDRDSGTESDDENAELLDIAKETEVELQSTEAQAPTPSSRSPVFSNVMASGRSLHSLSLNLVNAPTLVSPLEGDDLHDQSSMDSGCLANDPVSSHCSSDFERCSLDYDPSSSLDLERHSSEEELHTINHHHNSFSRELQAEKRTWSQANRCSSCCEISNSGSSSDEEVKDLLTPPQPLSFSSSPPKGVQKLARTTLPPKLFLANVTPAHVCSLSPRKRHRQTQCSDKSTTVMQRPCLDFEKMQKTCMLRKQMTHGLNRARIVKIKSFNGSSRPPKLMCDPAVFSFRSISMYTPLTPVEEPSVAF